MAKVKTGLSKPQLVPATSMLDRYQALQTTGIALPADAVEVNTSNFTRLAEGTTRLRLVSEPMYGQETWFRRQQVDPHSGEALTNDDGTPRMESRVMRYGPTEIVRTPPDLTESDGWARDRPRPFIAGLFFNYTTGKIEVFSPSKKELYESMFNLFRHSEDAVNPYLVDLMFSKKSDGNRVIGGKSIQVYNYTVTPTKEKAPGTELIEALQALDFIPDLNRLYAGEDPFDVPMAEEVDAALADESQTTASPAQLPAGKGK